MAAFSSDAYQSSAVALAEVLRIERAVVPENFDRIMALLGEPDRRWVVKQLDIYAAQVEALREAVQPRPAADPAYTPES